MSRVDRAVAEANRAVADAIGSHYDRRRFTVEKFARHRDGYLHARIIVDGKNPAYFHCRFGSWLAPGTFHGRSGLEKEPEALLGSSLGREVKFTLSEHAQRFTRAERQRLEETNGHADRADHTRRTGVSDAAVRVPDEGDSPDAP